MGLLKWVLALLMINACFAAQPPPKSKANRSPPPRKRSIPGASIVVRDISPSPPSPSPRPPPPPPSPPPSPSPSPPLPSPPFPPPSPPSPDMELLRFPLVLGTQVISPSYFFTSAGPLLEPARQVISMGSNLLKIALTPDYTEKYVGVQKISGVANVTALVSKHPEFMEVLDMPFAFYQLWVYTWANSARWTKSFTEADAKAEYNEVYELARYLLKRYSGSQKTFFLGSWENDWHLRPSSSPVAPIPADTVQRAIRWHTVRQEAVEDAKRDAKPVGVELYYYAEVNLVSRALTNASYPCMATSVLPYVNKLDFVSYSSYESIGNAEKSATVEKLLAVMNKLASQLRPKNLTNYLDPGKPAPYLQRVFVGEYGFATGPGAYAPITANGAVARARNISSALLSWGAPFLLQWEMYCNEIKVNGTTVTTAASAVDGKHNGFWLIDSNNVKQPLYYFHQRYFAAAQTYLASYKRANGGQLPPLRTFMSRMATMVLTV